MKTLRILILLLSGAIPMAVLLLWSGPTSQQTANAAPSSQTPAPSNSNQVRATAPRWRLAQDHADWAHMMEFLKVNSPNRYQIFSLHPNVPHPAIMRRLMQMEQIKDRQPRLYELRLQQLRTEDQVIGYLIQIRDAKARGDLIAEGQAYQNVRDSAGALVQLGIDERELRLNNIASLLNQAKQDLDRDKSKQNDLVKDRTSQIMMRADKANLFDGSPPTSSQATSPGAGN